MNEYAIGTLDSKTGFTEDVFLDNDFLLLPGGVPLSQKIRKFLFDWQFDKVFTDGEPGKPVASEKIQIQTPTSQSKPAPLQNQASGEKIAQCQKVYDEYCRFVEKIFTNFTTHKKIDYMLLATAMQRLFVYIKSDTYTMVRLRPQSGDNPLDDIIRHSMRSAVLAIAIGIQLKMTDRRIIDLGVAALIHEIGKLSLPQEIYMGTRQLSAAERELLHTQPRLGAETLSANGFPEPIGTGVFHHREREDGSGYPRHLASGNISTYGKIIAAACSFETISSPRNFSNSKEEALKEMADFLNNTGKQFDPRVIAALKQSQLVR